MKYIIILFMLIWVIVSILGIFKPMSLIESFPTLNKVIGIKQDNINDKILLVYRVIGILALFFGIFIFANLITGRLIF